MLSNSRRVLFSLLYRARFRFNFICNTALKRFQHIYHVANFPDINTSNHKALTQLLKFVHMYYITLPTRTYAGDLLSPTATALQWTPAKDNIYSCLSIFYHRLPTTVVCTVMPISRIARQSGFAASNLDQQTHAHSWQCFSNVSAI